MTKSKKEIKEEICINMQGAIGPEGLEILNKYKVSVRQYVLWQTSRFEKEAFWWGMLIAVVFSVPLVAVFGKTLLNMAKDLPQQIAENQGSPITGFLSVLFIMVLFPTMFVIIAIASSRGNWGQSKGGTLKNFKDKNKTKSFRKNILSSVVKGAALSGVKYILTGKHRGVRHINPGEYVLYRLTYNTATDYLKKIKPSKWGRISRFNDDKYLDEKATRIKKRLDAPVKTEKIISFNKKWRKIFKYYTYGIFVLGAIELGTAMWGHRVSAGLTIWLIITQAWLYGFSVLSFLSGLEHYRTQKITLLFDGEDSAYEGILARFWSVIIMFVGVGTGAFSVYVTYLAIK